MTSDCYNIEVHKDFIYSIKSTDGPTAWMNSWSTTQISSAAISYKPRFWNVWAGVVKRSIALSEACESNRTSSLP